MYSLALVNERPPPFFLLIGLSLDFCVKLPLTVVSLLGDLTAQYADVNTVSVSSAQNLSQDQQDDECLLPRGAACHWL